MHVHVHWGLVFLLWELSTLRVYPYIVSSSCRIGRKSPRLVRAAALKLAQELLDMVARPPVAMVTRTQEGTEHHILKLRFSDWEDALKVDFTKTTRMIEEREIERVRTLRD